MQASNFRGNMGNPCGDAGGDALFFPKKNSSLVLLAHCPGCGGRIASEREGRLIAIETKFKDMWFAEPGCLFPLDEGANPVLGSRSDQYLDDKRQLEVLIGDN